MVTLDTIEIKRKILHLAHTFWILIFLLCYFWFGRTFTILFAVFSLLVVLVAEFARLELGVKPGYIFSVRKDEAKKPVATVMLFTSSILVFAVFDLRIATAALLMTTFGDAISGLVGMKYGKVRVLRGNPKTLEGTLAGFCINLILATLVFFVFFPLTPWLFSLAFIVFMPFIASVVELFTNKIDDNLTVPVFTAFAGQLLLILLML
ncbi:hypothetical protein DRJ17_00585 [Candidatus Woesearchaeota archaeon]|nr:MAG: hypothetical protein DRJ17_00585 [Candidatus Woesearchaeota archaeon]